MSDTRPPTPPPALGDVADPRTDSSPGAGWWQANDGNWYPPETAPQVPVTVGAPHVGEEAGHESAGPDPYGLANPPPANARTSAITYDEHGWIKVDDPRPALAPAPPSSPNRLSLILAVSIAVVAVAFAALVFVPRGSNRTTTDAGTDPATGADRDTADVDPLTLDSVLTDINVRFSDVGDGYRAVIDGSIDPIGGDGCAQPRRPFVKVAATHWIAFDYEPNGLGGLPLGHLASSVSVFENEEEAQKRLFVERAPAYADCLLRWDSGVWFDGNEATPLEQRIDKLPLKLPNETAFAWRYTAIVEIEGDVFPVYTDHIVFTQDRVRVWTEVSSALVPFDETRRDLLVKRLAKRVDDALA